MSVETRQRFEIVIVRVRRFRWEWSMRELNLAKSVRRGYGLTRRSARDAALRAADFSCCSPEVREEFQLVKLRSSPEHSYPEPLKAVALSEGTRA